MKIYKKSPSLFGILIVLQLVVCLVIKPQIAAATTSGSATKTSTETATDTGTGGTEAVSITCPNGSTAQKTVCVINRDEFNPGLVCYNESLEATIVFDGYMNVHAALADENLVFTVSDHIYVVKKDTLEIAGHKFSDFTWVGETTKPQVYEVIDILEKNDSDTGDETAVMVSLERNGVRTTEIIIVNGEAMQITSFVKNLDGAEWIVPTAENTGYIGGSFGIKQIVMVGSTYTTNLVVSPSSIDSEFGTTKNTTAAYYAEDDGMLLFTVVDSTDGSTAINMYYEAAETFTKLVTDTIPYAIPRGGFVVSPGDPGFLVSASDRIEFYAASSFESAANLAYSELSIVSATNALMHETGQLVYTDMCPGTPAKGPYTAEQCDAKDNDGDLAIDENLTMACDENCYQPGQSTCSNGVWMGCVALPDSTCADYCPSDPLKTEAGICGCGVADQDLDADGTMDCIDTCPNDVSNLCLTTPAAELPTETATQTSTQTSTQTATPTENNPPTDDNGASTDESPLVNYSFAVNGGVACSLSIRDQQTNSGFLISFLFAGAVLGVIYFVRLRNSGPV